MPKLPVLDTPKQRQLPLLTPNRQALQPYLLSGDAAQLKPYEPTFREQTANFIANHMPSFLAPNQYEAQNLGDKFTTLAEFSPFGMLTAGDDYGRAKEQGDVPNMGLAALAAIPVLGAEARAAEKAGIRAFHGSPHSFDKFSLDKIGTGEGAQAYGHGLYFAENEGVAKSYRDALGKVNVDGRPIDEVAAPARAVAGQNEFGSYNLHKIKPGSAPDDSIIAAYIGDYGDPQKAILQMMEDGHDSAAQLASRMKNEGRLKEVGSMYEVNINADPSHFLDWDEPITANSPQAVRDALNKIANSSTPEVKAKLYEQVGQPGSMFYSVLGDAAKTGDLVKNQSAATQALKDAGIAGIKYKDAGSRFGHGEGTRNYVVFDDGLVNIVRKYGIAGAVGAGIITAEMGQQMQDQGLL